MDGGLWHYIGGMDQDHPQGKEMQKSKMVVWGGVTNSCEKKRCDRQRTKGKIYSTKCRVPKKSKERPESPLKWTMQINRGKNRMGKTRDLFKKITDTKGTFHPKMGITKHRTGLDLTEAEDIKNRW